MSQIPPPESLLTLAEASRVLPGHPCIPTIWRWCAKGCRGIRLKAIRLGRRWYISPAALQEFGELLAARSIEDLAAKSAAPVFEPPERRGRTEAQRARDIEQAKENLRRRGVLR